MSKKDQQLVTLATAHLTLTRENAALRQENAKLAAPPPPAPAPPAPPAPKTPVDMTRAEIEAATPATGERHTNARNALGRALALRERGQALYGGKR